MKSTSPTRAPRPTRDGAAAGRMSLGGMLMQNAMLNTAGVKPEEEKIEEKPEPPIEEEKKEPEPVIKVIPVRPTTPVWVDPSGQGRPYADLSFAEKLSIKLGIKNVTEDMVLEDFMAEFLDSDHADVAARDAVFGRIAADFSCEVGKVGQTTNHPFHSHLLTI